MAGRDASEVLELVEEASDEVALAVQVMGCGALLPAIPLGRDVGARAMVGNELEDGAGVAAAGGDGVPGRLKAVKEGRPCILNLPLFGSLNHIRAEKKIPFPFITRVMDKLCLLLECTEWRLARRFCRF